MGSFFSATKPFPPARMGHCVELRACTVAIAGLPDAAGQLHSPTQALQLSKYSANWPPLSVGLWLSNPVRPRAILTARFSCFVIERLRFQIHFFLV